MIPRKEDTKFITIFRLLRYLFENKPYTIAELAKRLDASERTIRRYLDEDLPNIGIVPVKDPKTKTYTLNSAKNISLKLSYGFSLEEMLFLKDLLLATQENPLRNSILEKVFQDSEIKSIADTCFKIANTEVIRKLVIAIQEKRQVILKKYYSIQSNTCKDRLVEPLQLTHKFTQVSCYELAKGAVVNFNISRIERVELLDTLRTYAGDVLPTDAFGLSGKEAIPVELALSEKAYWLMKEEFPATESDLSREGQQYFYRGCVRSYKGIARFILGLPGEVKILHDDGLRNFVQEELKKFDF